VVYKTPLDKDQLSKADRLAARFLPSAQCPHADVRLGSTLCENSYIGEMQKIKFSNSRSNGVRAERFDSRDAELSEMLLHVWQAQEFSHGQKH
jgi:hypothetical protein